MFIKIVCPLEGWFSHQMSRQFLCSGLNTALPMLVSCPAYVRGSVPWERTLLASLFGVPPKYTPTMLQHI